MSKIKTITATTTEQTITFDATYQFVWFRSLGDGDVLVSDHSGIVAGTDDVALVKGGDSTRITVPYNKTVYIKAVSDSVDMEIHAQNFSDAPFEGGSGGGGGGSITIDPTPTQGSSNAVSSGGVYTALQNVGGLTRTLLYDCGAYNTGAPYQTVTSLLDNLSKYDFIVIMSGTNADYTATGVYVSDQYIFDARFIMASSAKTIRINSIQNRQTIVEFTDTTFKITYHQANDSNYMQVYNIYGYKFG